MNTQIRYRTTILVGAVLTVASLQRHTAYSHEKSVVGSDVIVTPLISPNGQRVAFGEFIGVEIPGARKSGRTRLIVCNLDGSDRRVVGEVGWYPGRVLWYGNDEVLFTQKKLGEYYRLSRVGKERSPLALPRGCEVIYKRLSPNGKRIAYVGYYEADKGKPEYGLFLVTVETGNVVKLMDDPRPRRSPPAWSPDSRRLAVTANDYVQLVPELVLDHPLMLVDVETGEITHTRVNGVGAAWSSDGRFIACTTEPMQHCFSSGGVPLDGTIGVWDVNLETMNRLTPAGYDRHDDDGYIVEVHGSLNPLWSPNGEWIAYRQIAYSPGEQKPSQSPSTWMVADSAGGGLYCGTQFRKVVDGRAEVAWTPDSRSLICVQNGEVSQVSLWELECDLVLCISAQ